MYIIEFIYNIDNSSVLLNNHCISALSNYGFVHNTLVCNIRISLWFLDLLLRRLPIFQLFAVKGEIYETDLCNEKYTRNTRRVSTPKMINILND